MKLPKKIEKIRDLERISFLQASANQLGRKLTEEEIARTGRPVWNVAFNAGYAEHMKLSEGLVEALDYYNADKGIMARIALDAYQKATQPESEGE